MTNKTSKIARIAFGTPGRRDAFCAGNGIGASAATGEIGAGPGIGGTNGEGADPPQRTNGGTAAPPARRGSQADAMPTPIDVPTRINDATGKTPSNTAVRTSP